MYEMKEDEVLFLGNINVDTIVDKGYLKELSLQMILFTNSNARLCKGIEYMDNKL